MNPGRHQFGLLLSGGGARAAYQVGVLKAIAHLMPRNHEIPFPIICGNSAGAINAASLACYASCYHLGVRKLEWVWKHFHTQQVYAADSGAVFSYLAKNFAAHLRSKQFTNRATSLLNNAPLRRLLNQMLDFKRIDRNILRRHLRAVCVTTSSYTHHEAVSYFQGQSDLNNWQREQRRGVATQLHVEHLMASSAIPLVFPSVRIDGEYLGDGSVHQLSPLSAPIHLGAQKILVIGVEEPEQKKPFGDPKRYPANAEIAGHLLDTLFADTLHSDLERLQRVNSTLALLDEKQRQRTHLKPVDCMVINPSENFTQMAYDHYDDLPRGGRMLLRMLGVNRQSDSSILSYLLFEKQFCRRLIDLGYRDGEQKLSDIRRFLAL